MKHFFLLPILMIQAIALTSLATTEASDEEVSIETEMQICIKEIEKLQISEEEKKAKAQEVKSKAEELQFKWNKYVGDYIRDARLRHRTNIDPINLGKLGTISGGNEFVSEPSIGGNYSGIDDWDINLSSTLLSGSWGNLGTSSTRKITFIQQFKSRCESVLRLPYDPITKLPINTERALALKPGDFVAFSAPLTLSLGKNLSHYVEATKHTQINISANYFTQGEVNVHVFRMAGNYVRVRLFAGKSTGYNFNMGFNIIGVNGMVIKYILDLNPIEFFYSSSRSNLFSTDYVFNLNDEAARKQYDQVLGQRYSMAAFQANAVNPFASHESFKNQVYGDLEAVDKIAFDDLKKPLEQRTIIRVSRGENFTISTRTGIRINVKLIKLESSLGLSESQITLFDAVNNAKYYVIKSHSKESKLKVFEFWGEENKNNSGFILSTDSKFEPKSIVGLEMVRMKQELNLEPGEMAKIKNGLEKMLPEKIYSQLKFPDTSASLGRLRNAHFEQALFFNAKAFENLPTFNHAEIQKITKELLLSWGGLSSIPMGIVGDDDPRLKAKKEGDLQVYHGKQPIAYLDAYSHEIGYMAAYISDMFNEDKPLLARVESHNKLNSNMDLFKEIGAVIILRLIPNEKLEELLTYRLLISGRGISPINNEFPKNADMTQTNLYNSVLSQNSFVTDRTHNLRMYLSETGEPMSLKETLDKSK